MTKRVIYNSAKTGRFVTEKYAKSHPATTEKHIVKVPPPSKSK